MAFFNLMLTARAVGFAALFAPLERCTGETRMDIVYILLIAALYAATHVIVWAISRLRDGG